MTLFKGFEVDHGIGVLLDHENLRVSDLDVRPERELQSVLVLQQLGVEWSGFTHG